jgi:hypothetical protein
MTVSAPAGGAFASTCAAPAGGTGPCRPAARHSLISPSRRRTVSRAALSSQTVSVAGVATRAMSRAWLHDNRPASNAAAIFGNDAKRRFMSMRVRSRRAVTPRRSPA